MSDIQTKRFQRNEENFTCEYCGFRVIGSGYTNHCPRCLWSRHVDVNPGDRKESCRGMMEPIFAEPYDGGYKITYRCKKCGIRKSNMASRDDDIELITKLSSEPV